MISMNVNIFQGFSNLSNNNEVADFFKSQGRCVDVVMDGRSANEEQGLVGLVAMEIKCVMDLLQVKVRYE